VHLGWCPRVVGTNGQVGQGRAGGKKHDGKVGTTRGEKGGGVAGFLHVKVSFPGGEGRQGRH